MSDSESESAEESVTGEQEERGEHASVQGEADEQAGKEIREKVYGSPRASLTEIRNVLTEEDAGLCLERLGKIFQGGAYAFLKIRAINKNLNDISVITQFEHLMFVDVSSNRLSIDDLFCITTMPHVIAIYAERNRLMTFNLPTMRYLQFLGLNHNYIRSTENLVQPQLIDLAVNYNQLKEVVGLNEEDLPKLVNLELRGNSLRNLDGISFSTLASLYIAENYITTLNGIDRLVSLKTLHVRNNPIVVLDGFSEAMNQIEYINFRECGIIDLEEFRKLASLQSLKILVVSHNPFNEDAEEDYRVAILVLLPTLMRIDKTNIDAAEKAEAKERREGEENLDEEDGDEDD